MAGWLTHRLLPRCGCLTWEMECWRSARPARGSNARATVAGDTRNQPDPRRGWRCADMRKPACGLCCRPALARRRSEPGCAPIVAMERRSTRRRPVPDVPTYEAASQGSSLEPCRPLPAAGRGVSLFGGLRKSAMLDPSGPARAGMQPSSVLWCEALGSQTTDSVLPSHLQPGNGFGRLPRESLAKMKHPLRWSNLPSALRRNATPTTGRGSAPGAANAGAAPCPAPAARAPAPSAAPTAGSAS